jgi:hypothetical protein
MRINYNGVELQQIKLRNMQVFAEKDPTGCDVTMSRAEIDVDFQWHPYATASFPGAQIVVNDDPPVGDGPGLSIRNLRRQLNQPRQLLKVELGPDSVWQRPFRFRGRR